MRTDRFTINLNKTGLAAAYKEWQVPIMVALLSGAKLTSLDAWRIYAPTRSRASVINFLEAQLECGVLEAVSVTGKGGHHNIYHAATTEANLMQTLRDAANAALKEEK